VGKDIVYLDLIDEECAVISKVKYPLTYEGCFINMDKPLKVLRSGYYSNGDMFIIKGIPYQFQVAWMDDDYYYCIPK